MPSRASRTARAPPRGPSRGRTLSVLRDDEPIDWDGDELRFVIGIAGHEGGHLEILSKVALAFSDTDEVDALLGSVDEE
jgi:PTS system mannitol-specific IIA component